MVDIVKSNNVEANHSLFYILSIFKFYHHGSKVCFSRKGKPG